MTTLSARISQRVKASRSSRIARNLAAFLAQRDEIRHALEDGWTLYQIWETLHAEQKVAMSYSTFCNHVKRLITQRGQTPVPVVPDPGIPGSKGARGPGGRHSLPSPAGTRWTGGAAPVSLPPALVSSRPRPPASPARAPSSLNAGFTFSSTPNDEDIL